MAGETLFAGQAAPNQVNDNIAPDNRGLAQRFTCSVAGRFAVGGGVYVQGGIYPERWQFWNEATTTLLLDLLMAPLAPTGTGWRYFTFAELSQAPYAVPQSTALQVATWTPNGAGKYVYSDGGFGYPFGQSPLSTTGCAYRNGGLSSEMPNSFGFTSGRFYADIVLDTPASAPRSTIYAPRTAAQQSSRW